MADVFISYSRKDTAFVRRLHDALAARNRDTWVDWEDIPLTAEWWSEIQRGIEAADTFVFVISPDSARSKMCFDEVEHAHQNNKRIVPILHREVTEEPDQERLHRTISRHNWAFFRAEDDFDAAFDKLIDALDTDLDHVKRHTDLLLRAKNWDAIGRVASPLLRGADLRAAEAWLASVGDKEPKPTDLHTAYILASRQAANRFQRTVLASVSLALIIMAALTVLSSGLFRQSEDRRQESDQRGTGVAEALELSDQRGTAVAEQAEISRQNEATAVAAQKTSEANLYEARRVQSLYLADLSQQQLVAGAPQDALLLGLESLQYYRPGEPDSVFTTEGSQALTMTLSAFWQETVFMRQDDAVDSAAWNADETQILSWAYDGTVRVWDAATGTPQLVLRHDDAVDSAAWNADETQILSWAYDGTVRVWDAVTGTPQLVLRHQDEWITGAVWNTDETQILSTGGDAVRVWDAVTGAELLVLRHSSQVNGAVWNADETRILSWANDNTARVWDATTGEGLLTLTHDREVLGAEWNKNETQILSWSYDGFVRIWNARTGAIIQKLGLNLVGGSSGAAWNADETQILVWSRGNDPFPFGVVGVWDVATDNIRLDYHYDQWIWGAEWNADGTQYVAFAADGTARLWDATTHTQRLALRHDSGVYGAAWNADETRLITWSGDTTARVWDTTTGNELLTLRHDSTVGGAIWNADETQILTWSQDGAVRIWQETDSAGGTTVRLGERASNVAWNPAETQILFSLDSTVRVLDIATKTEVLTLHHDDEVQGARWNADATQILSWSNDGTVRVWNVATGEERLKLSHGPGIRDAAWNSDETRILSASSPVIKIWDAAPSTSGDTGADPLIMLFHDNPLAGWAWHPSEPHLLTWDNGETAHVWDAVTGTELLTWQHVSSAAWSPTGNQILAESQHAQVAVWNAITGDQLYTVPDEASIETMAWNADATQFLVWSNSPWEFSEAAEQRIRTGTIRVFDVADGTELSTFDYEQGINGAIWNADGTRLLIWCDNGSVHLRDVATGDDLLTLPHNSKVNGVQWNSDETRILTWADDQTVRVWDVATGMELLTLAHYHRGVHEARWNRDETRILTRVVYAFSPQPHTGAVQQINLISVHIWPGNVTELIALAKAHTRRALSNEQRAAFFLPTLEPTATPTARPTLTPLPEVTPLPTLTPSITPTPTATPTTTP